MGNNAFLVSISCFHFSFDIILITICKGHWTKAAKLAIFKLAYLLACEVLGLHLLGYLVV